ncbi:hypothetical protein ACFE04_004206 [Oxalis oulophora]
MEDSRVIDMEIDMDKLTVVMDTFHYGLQSLWDNRWRKVLVQSSLREMVELLERDQVPVADNPSLALISQKCREFIQADWVCQLSLKCVIFMKATAHKGRQLLEFLDDIASNSC